MKKVSKSISQDRGESSIKQEHILEAAIKRFSYFGVHKTTLTEIAEDLAITKPLLSYYFTDKHSLIAAVASNIIREFLDAAGKTVGDAISVEAGLSDLVEVKRNHFKKYFLLALQGDSIDLQKLPGEISAVYQQGRLRLIDIISGLLQKGIDNNLIRPVDTQKTGKLLLETLAAFEYCMKHRNAVPSLTDIDEVFDKQQEVVTMFLNGIKQN